MSKILLPIDIGHLDATTRVMEQARKLAAAYDVTFVLLHVMDVIPSLLEAEIPDAVLEGHERGAAAKLMELASQYGIADRAEVIVKRGKPQHEIVAAAESSGAEIIVIASHQPSAKDILLGSVAASVVRHAHCSVMVLR